MSRKLIDRIEGLYPAKNKFADVNEVYYNNASSLFVMQLRENKEFKGTEYEENEEIEGDNKV